MAKLAEAQVLLLALGLPPAQRADIAAYTLLALSDLSEGSAWKEARRRTIRIHEIIVFLSESYSKTYAENSRETIRRQVLHQFEQAQIAERNPDEPALATNSPRTHYALTRDALTVIRSFGSSTFDSRVKTFQSKHSSLAARYARIRSSNLIPVTFPDGSTKSLSPGAHNLLQAAIVQEFLPRFAPGAQLLYLGDARDKLLHVNEDVLVKIGVPISAHDKLPDIVALSKSGRLFLIEAVTSHGPVSPKRYVELEQVVAAAPPRIYVSAFPDWRTFQRHARQLAWETEVWVAEAPTHMIHFNGEGFLR